MEKPLDLIGRLYDEEFGLRPTNFSIKPVHVANGLTRSLTGRSYKSTALAQTLRRWVRNQKLGLDEERNPTVSTNGRPGILDRYAEAFATRGEVLDVETINDLRSLAFDVLGTDGAVFDDPDKSSYTLSNERLITRDPSDNRSGLFLARLLTAGTDGDAAQKLREILTTETDPWTIVGLPLLAFAEPREEALDGEQADLAQRADHLFALDPSGHLASSTLAKLRTSFDRLARFEAFEGSKLNSLRRLVLFGCFVIHVHLCTRWAEAVDGAPRPPILFDMFDGGRFSVRDASSASLRAAGDAVEGLLSHRMRAYFADAVSSEAEAKAILAEQEQLEPETQRRRLAPELRRRFTVHREGGLAPADALAEAFLEVGYEATRGHPVGFLTELGRRAGYLTPWANQGRGGKLRKRYGVTAEFLETLVAATVEPDDPLDFPEFLDALRDTYGILVGRRGDDASIRANNLLGAMFGTPTSISEEDLRLNVEELRLAVIEVGYAKAYADGQTVVTVTPEGRSVV